MTVLSSETRLVGTGLALLPRVNLLPPEIAEKRAFRRIQVGLGCAVVASVGIVGLLYTSAAHSVSNAQESVDTAQTENLSLKSQTARLSNVTAINAKAAAAEAMLKTAMGDEVRYSQLLNDLSLSVPGNVWLKNISYTAAAATAPRATTAVAPVAPGASTARAARPAVAPVTPIGTFTATAVAFSHDDVALWLESMAGLKGYANPYFSTSTEALIGTRKVVNFTSTAIVTSAAQSGRYNKPAGS